jgi:hypothetical protein
MRRSTHLSGRNSAVECQLPKLDVTGSIPVARSKILGANQLLPSGSFGIFAQKPEKCPKRSQPKVKAHKKRH